VEVLSALGLWEARDVLTSRLTPGQMAACDLLPSFLGKGNLICMDDTLDFLDPWTLQGVWRLLGRFREKGGALLVTTNQASIAQKLGALIVVKDLKVKFAGTVRDLLAETRTVEMTVETKDAAAIRALAEPFTFSIRQEGDVLYMVAADGQALAAKLLVEGYGRVRAITTREQNLSEAILDLV
jgi:ABC-type multidrug transport system ATPase subunit